MKNLASCVIAAVVLVACGGRADDRKMGIIDESPMRPRPTEEPTTPSPPEDHPADSGSDEMDAGTSAEFSQDGATAPPESETDSGAPDAPASCQYDDLLEEAPGAVRVYSLHTDGRVSGILASPEDFADKVDSLTEYNVVNMSDRPVRFREAVIEAGYEGGEMADIARTLTGFGYVDIPEWVAVKSVQRIRPATFGDRIVLDFTEDCVVLQPGDTYQFDIGAHGQIPLPTSVPGDKNVPRSGDLVSLKLTHLTANDGTEVAIEPHDPAKWVLRKSKPRVRVKELSDLAFRNGESDLYRFKIWPERGALAWTYTEIGFTKSGSAKITNLKLRRGDVLLDPSTYRIRVFTAMNDPLWDDIAPERTAGAIVISFFKEEIIPKLEEVVYTLSGDVSGVLSGDGLRIGITASISERSGNGYLLDDPTYGMFGYREKGDVSHYYATFLWSDLSEDPHSDAFFPNGSSDWINDVFVIDSDLKITLSAP